VHAGPTPCCRGLRACGCPRRTRRRAQSRAGLSPRPSWVTRDAGLPGPEGPHQNPHFGRDSTGRRETLGNAEILYCRGFSNGYAWAQTSLRVPSRSSRPRRAQVFAQPTGDERLERSTHKLIANNAGAPLTEHDWRYAWPATPGFSGA
jgi:hypothetical protein